MQHKIFLEVRDLSKRLQLKGVKFTSETDTEVIPHLISIEIQSFLEKGLSPSGSTLLSAVHNVLRMLKGTYSIAVIWSKAPDALVVARRQAPLVLGFGEGEYFCASDTAALVGFTREHAIVTLNSLYFDTTRV